MKFQYLGTAAAEGIPAVFCDCETCKCSRKLGGRNIRTRSQAIIDDTLLIDFPADTYLHYLRYRVPLTKIKSCIITHSHTDHLYPMELEMRVESSGFAHIDHGGSLTFYAAESGYKMIRNAIEYSGASNQEVCAVLITPFESFETDGYHITPIPASHDPKSSPVIFDIEKGGKSILYAHDTSALSAEGMEYLKQRKKPFNVISLDCTEACKDIDYVGHMNLERCIAMREDLINIGVANEQTQFILNHFSHNGSHVIYDDFVKIAAEQNFAVSYDGMVIEF